jgi:hypothetical protein
MILNIIATYIFIIIILYMFWVELFIDKNHIIESNDSEDLIIRTHRPKFHSTIFKPKDSWDNYNFTTYFNITPFKGKYYMYYRGNLPVGNTSYHHENTCVLISEDGYTWTKPNVGIYKDSVVVKPRPSGKVMTDPKSPSDDPKNKSNDSKNNVIWKSDAISHNFYAFENHQDLDKLSAIGGLHAGSCNCCAKGIYLMSSTDAINWQQGKMILRHTNSLSQAYGTYYDSMNTVVWDTYRKQYRIFLRYNYERGVRDIQTQISTNLDEWISPETLYYKLLYKQKDSTPRCYYMSNIWAHPNNGYYIGFPSGQSGDFRESQTIDLMVSRDGVHWDVIERTWFGDLSVSPERMIPYVIPCEASNQFLLYVNDAKYTQVQMYTIRRDGFTSLATNKANVSISFKTHPIWLKSDELTFNYVIESSGSLTVFLNDEDSAPILDVKGPTDNSKHVVKLNTTTQTSKYIHLRFVMTNAEIFSYSFHTNPDKVTLHKYNRDEYANVVSLHQKPPPPPKKNKTPKVPTSTPDQSPSKTNKSVKNLTDEARYVGIDKNLETINKILAENPAQEIKYVYTDLCLQDPIGSERVFTSTKPIKKITKAQYSNYNSAEKGKPTFGRTFTFTTVDIDDQIKEITLINNFRANCIVEFI